MKIQPLGGASVAPNMTSSASICLSQKSERHQAAMMIHHGQLRRKITRARLACVRPPVMVDLYQLDRGHFFRLLLQYCLLNIPQRVLRLQRISSTLCLTRTVVTPLLRPNIARLR